MNRHLLSGFVILSSLLAPALTASAQDHAAAFIVKIKPFEVAEKMPLFKDLLGKVARVEGDTLLMYVRPYGPYTGAHERTAPAYSV
jgi:hypothetical protein